MSLSEDLAAIGAKTGLVVEDVSAIVNEEHARYEFYMKAFALASPSGDVALLRAVLRDPDHSMGGGGCCRVCQAASSTTYLMPLFCLVGQRPSQTSLETDISCPDAFWNG